MKESTVWSVVLGLLFVVVIALWVTGEDANHMWHRVTQVGVMYVLVKVTLLQERLDDKE